jgi:hypothetical protein
LLIQKEPQALGLQEKSREDEEDAFKLKDFVHDIKESLFMMLPPPYNHCIFTQYEHEYNV